MKNFYWQQLELFTKMGGAGLDFGLGCQDNTVSNCEVNDISGTGI
jgi:hypothetical protein